MDAVCYLIEHLEGYRSGIPDRVVPEDSSPPPLQNSKRDSSLTDKEVGELSQNSEDKTPSKRERKAQRRRSRSRSQRKSQSESSERKEGARFRNKS
jgi:hypothetical protein